MHDGATRVLSAAMIVLGVLLVLRGAALLAVVLGVAMVGAGGGRLWVVSQRRRPR